MKSQPRVPLDKIIRQTCLYHKDHDRSPYTWFKARYYMACASYLVYFLQRYRFNPNILTIIYGLLGIIGGVLLAIPNKWCILTAVLIFFNKGIIDWADGPYARLTKQTSEFGAKLDNLCGWIGTIAFYGGLCVYLGLNLVKLVQ